MKHFDQESLKKLAKLARIGCTELELKQLETNLEKVLDYIDQLQKVDTDGVSPCDRVIDYHHTSLREDETDESYSRKEFLDNSPDHVGGMIRVPAVIKYE